MPTSRILINFEIVSRLTIHRFLILVLLLQSIYSRQINAQPLYLKNRTIQLNSGLQPWFDFIITNRHRMHPVSQTDCIIQIKQRRFANLRHQPFIKLHEYIPKNAFYATLDTGLIVSDLESMGIYQIYFLQPIDKIASTLNAELLLNKDTQRIYSVWIHLSPQLSEITAKNRLSELLDYKEQMPLMTYIGPLHAIAMDLPASKIEALLLSDIIKFIDQAPEEGFSENDQAISTHRANTIIPSSSSGIPLDGSGIHIQMNDEGIIGNHIDYLNRITQDEALPTPVFADHADHIAGTLIGAGNKNPRYAGVAKAALLTVHSYTTDPSSGLGLFDFPDAYLNHDIVITSTSQSDGCNTGYTSFAQLMDAQIFQLPSLMHVFSAGNNAYISCGYGAGTGWGTITGGHKQAKNIIAVGNLTKEDLLVANSSRGPAKDGRIKPECVAVGTNVTSTSDNPTDNVYATKSGSSHACPGVAGSLALLYQGYRILHAGDYPGSDLMKALLLNSCDDLGNPGPDFKFGFGRIHARRSYQVLESNQFFTDSVSDQNHWTQTIIIPNQIHELRIMLYWNDREGSVLSSKSLVQDLDLTLRDPALNIYLPWVLDHTPDASALDAPATPKVDTLNNIEQITLIQPSAGTWTIDVSGTDVPWGYQPFALVYELVSPSVQVSYPNGSERWVPGETERIRWDAYNTSSAPFKIEYSSDAGNSWQLIADNISHSLRYYDWVVPNALGHTFLIKIQQDIRSDISDGTFSIMSEVTHLSMDSVCDNQVKLVWDAVSGAVGYTIYQLGNLYMDSISYTSETEKWISFSSVLSDHWFAVSALASDETKSRRCVAINNEGNVLDCHTGTDILETSNAVHIYPNPAREQIRVSASSKKINAYNITNIIGKSYLMDQTGFQNQEPVININQLADGVYLLHVLVESEWHTVRFVKIGY